MGYKFEKLSILIVEDTEPMRTLLGDILKTLGVGRIFFSTEGQDGFQKVVDNRPDIVICDWLMEPVNGLELVEMIRNHPNSPNPLLPVIMMTGFSALPRVERARDMGTTEFLVKPFSAKDLAKRIAYVIEKPRDFIKAPEYFGPDRRRRFIQNYTGPFRRDADKYST